MFLLLAACVSTPVPPGTPPPAVALAPSSETLALLPNCEVVVFLATGSSERAALTPYFDQLGAVVTDQALDPTRAKVMGIRGDRQVGVRCGDHRVRLPLRGIDPEMDASVHSALTIAARPITPVWWTGGRTPALTPDLATSLGHLAVTLGETVPVRPVDALPPDAGLLVLAERSPDPEAITDWVNRGGALLVLLGDHPAPLVPLLDRLGVTVGAPVPSEGAVVLAHPVTATIDDRPLVLGTAPALTSVSPGFTPLFSAPVAAALTVGSGRVLIAPAALFSDQALASHGNLQLLFGARAWLLPPDPPLYVGKSRVEPFVDPEPVELTTPALRLTWSGTETVTVEEREDAAGVYPWVTVAGAHPAAFRGNAAADALLDEPVKSIRKISGELDLRALGLDPPQALLTAAAIPGDTVTLRIGGNPWEKDERFVKRDNVTWLTDGRAFAPLEFPDRLRETRLQPLYLPELVALEIDDARYVPIDGRWDDTAAAVALAVREAKAGAVTEALRTPPRTIRFVGSAAWELSVWPEKKGCVVRSSWLRATVKVEDDNACKGMLTTAGGDSP